MSEPTRYYLRDRNRITGPFDLDQLDSLKRRGRIARFQLLSIDRRNWVKADTVPGLFRPDELEEEIDVAPEPASKPAPEPAEEACWYFAEGEQHAGPVAASVIRSRMNIGSLNAETPVWREGMDAWQPAGTVPEFAPSGSFAGPASISASGSTIPPIRPAGGKLRGRSVPMAAIVIPFVLLGVGGLLLFALRTGIADRGARGLIVSGFDDDTRISGAVGYVVVGWEVERENGTVEDDILGFGSCFAVTSDGYLITNEHVVEEIAPRTRMSEENLLKDFLDEKARQHIEIEGILKRRGQEYDSKAEYLAEVDGVQQVRPKIWVFFGNRDAMYQARIVHESERFDMAVLKVDRPAGPHFALIPESERLSRGQRVHALGFPGSANMDISDEEKILKATSKATRVGSKLKDRVFEYSMTSGVMSKYSTEQVGRTWIQHDATITQGNSGGPLVDDKGRVVAINTLGIGGDAHAARALYSGEIRQMVPELTPIIPNLGR